MKRASDEEENEGQPQIEEEEEELKENSLFDA